MLRPGLRTGLTLCLLLLPMAAMAQGMTFPSGLQTTIASFTVHIIAGMNLLTWVFFVYLTILLDPSFIFNTQDGAGFITVLNNIWILSRDLMNIAFALALIGAAVYTIVTAKKDFVAAHIKTFILAVILVNFSWFIPRVILDVANVASSAIYGIPSLLVERGISEQCRFTTSMDMRPNVSCNEIPPQTEGGSTTYNCQCAMLVDAEFFLSDKRASELASPAPEQLPDGVQGPPKPAESTWECPLGSVMCLEFKNLDMNTVAGHSAVLNGLIVNHARLQGLAGVPPVGNGSEVDAMIKFMLQQMMVLIIHAALFFPLAAMAAAFAIRIPVLWITIAFMPFALLKFIVPQEYTGDYPQKIWDWFLKAAFLPAMVAVPLTIGFILVNAGVQMLNATTVVSRINTIGFRLADGVSNLFELLWLGITLGVLYAGVFTVLGKVEFVAPVTDFIKNIGKGMGAAVLKAPLALPFIPGPGGSKTSVMQHLKQIDPRAISQKLSSDPRGLPGVLEDIRTGGVRPGSGAGPAASQFAENRNTAELHKLNEKIAALRTAIGAGGATPDLAEKFAREIRDELKIDIPIPIDHNNLEASLRAFQTELSKQTNVNGAALNGLDTEIDQLRDALAKSPPPAPAS